MRDMLFKNLTSDDKRRKIISSSEIVDKKGVRSITRRHFVCMIKEMKKGQLEQKPPSIYVLKKQNTKDQTGKFFCKIKGSMNIVINERLYRIIFMHTLKITLELIPQADTGNTR